MKALLQIIRRVTSNPQQPCALATLVAAEGSTYRRPGARLLVEPDGKTWGVLSGGCLEEEIARFGQEVINDSSPRLLSFDTRRLYGCDGRLEILIEPIPPAKPHGNLITKIGERLQNRSVCRIRACYRDELLGSELLPPDILLPARRGVLIDTILPPVRLLLFGTGPEIEPLTQLSTSLGWMVQQFSRPSELAPDFRSDSQTAAVVMNHNFGRDLLSLHRLLPLQLRYVGLLGPRKRHAEILGQLSEYGTFDFSSALSRLYAPAGLDIGSEAPEEIALAIISEVSAVLSNRSGGFLRERKTSIHAMNAAKSEAA